MEKAKNGIERTVHKDYLFAEKSLKSKMEEHLKTLSGEYKHKSFSFVDKETPFLMENNELHYLSSENNFGPLGIIYEKSNNSFEELFINNPDKALFKKDYQYEIHWEGLKESVKKYLRKGKMATEKDCFEEKNFRLFKPLYKEFINGSELRILNYNDSPVLLNLKNEPEEDRISSLSVRCLELNY